jgi:hypothetical protein
MNTSTKKPAWIRPSREASRRTGETRARILAEQGHSVDLLRGRSARPSGVLVYSGHGAWIDNASEDSAICFLRFRESISYPPVNDIPFTTSGWRRLEPGSDPRFAPPLEICTSVRDDAGDTPRNPAPQAPGACFSRRPQRRGRRARSSPAA